MENHESEFNKAGALLKGVRLSEADKSAMLKNIYREAGTSPITKAVPSPFSFTAFFQNHRYASSFVVMVFLMAGVAEASALSLPGDPLYGIKINVVEPVALALQLSETSKNEYRVAVLQERVEEIQKLKAEGRLNFDVETISHVIAEENLAQIETSAMFTATGTNLEVSGHVETYNSLVEEVHKLKTVIKTDTKKDGDDKKEDVDEDEPASIVKPADEVASKVEDEVDETLKNTVDAAAAVADPVIEEASKTLTAPAPVIKDILGQ